MPFWRLYYHIVWTKKYRALLITPQFEKTLYPYLDQKARELGCRLFAINGWIDHVHILIAIPPKLAVAEVVKRLKGASSHEFEDIHWQRGYGALTVGERQRSIAVAYVQNQKEHHTQQTTYAWLERCEELDAGLPDDGLTAVFLPGTIPGSVKEFDYYEKHPQSYHLLDPGRQPQAGRACAAADRQHPRLRRAPI